MVVSGSPKRWDWWHSPIPQLAGKIPLYIPLIVLAEPGGLCATVPSFWGNQKQTIETLQAFRLFLWQTPISMYTFIFPNILQAPKHYISLGTYFFNLKNSKHHFSTPKKKYLANCRTKNIKNLRSSGPKREAKWIDFPPSLLVATRSAPPRWEVSVFWGVFLFEKKDAPGFFQGKGGFRKRCLTFFVAHECLFFSFIDFLFIWKLD